MSSRYLANNQGSNSEVVRTEDGKNCKLCRKKLSNEHFLNPKTGLLFSVCDICRKRKRDKYWKNKELLQQSTIDTRHSTRNRHNKQQKQEAALVKNNKALNDFHIKTTPDLDFVSTSIQPRVGNTYGIPLSTKATAFNPPIKGSLIVVPPYISQYIISNRHNPSAIRSYIGDYYWKALCSPN